MRVITSAGQVIELGTTETAPTIGIIDFSRRVTDDFGVTTVVPRDFARRMSVRVALPTDTVDATQRRLADLRATPARWEADERFASLNFQGFYKDFELDLAVPPTSFCTLTVEGLAASEAVADSGGDPAPLGSPSTLRLLQPVIVAGGGLVASSVPETDFPEWSSATSYALGAKVIKAAMHRIYESAAAANAGNDPAGASGKWIDVGPTKRWAMFDQALGTVTSAAGSISVTMSVGQVDAVALLDVVGSTIRVQSPGYDRTKAAGAGTTTFLDMPSTNGQVIVTITGSGQVSVGTLLIGHLVSLGVTEASPTAGINDFSRKVVDDFGVATVVQRAWAKRMAVRSLIRTDAVDVVANRIAAVRARPSLWIGDEGLDSLTVYGFFKEYSITVGEIVSDLSLTIEGLSKATPLVPLIPETLGDLDPVAAAALAAIDGKVAAAAAKLLFLTSDRQGITLNAAGQPFPTAQTTTFTATRRNTSAVVAWSITNGVGAAARTDQLMSFVGPTETYANFVRWSEDSDQWTSRGPGITTSKGYSAHDGSLTATKITCTPGAGAPYIYPESNRIPAASGFQTQQMFLKAGTRSVVKFGNYDAGGTHEVNLAAGTLAGSGLIYPVGDNGWFYVELRFSGSVAFGIWPAGYAASSGDGDFYISNAQAVSGATGKPFIRTTGAEAYAVIALGASISAANVNAARGATSNVTVTANLFDGGFILRDYVSINVAQDGSNALTGYLTNEDVTLAASSTGVISDFSSAAGKFVVLFGTLDVTEQCTFSSGAASAGWSIPGNLTLSNTAGSRGAYAMVSEPNISLATMFIDLKATHTASNTTITKRFTFSRSRQGTTGDTGLSVAEITVYARGTNPGTPTGGTYSFATKTLTTVPANWSILPPSGTGPLYAAKGTASAMGSGAVSLVWVGTGQIAQDGTTGGAGASVDVIFVRSTTQPTTPTASAETPTGWSTDVASVPSSALPLWSSFGQRAGGVANYTWDTPARVEGAKGETGDKGLSIAEVMIFRRAATKPATPTTGTYGFDGKAMVALPADWADVPQAGNLPLWAAKGTAASATATGNVAVAWVGVGQISQDGVGVDGSGVDVIFTRAATQPGTPTASTGVPSGWYTDVASVPGSANPLWSSFGQRPNSTVAYTWDTAARVEGATGLPGADGRTISLSVSQNQVLYLADGVTQKPGQSLVFNATKSANLNGYTTQWRVLRLDGTEIASQPAATYVGNEPNDFSSSDQNNLVMTMAKFQAVCSYFNTPNGLIWEVYSDASGIPSARQTITKSLDGAKGADGPTLDISAPINAFTYVDNVLSPPSQTIVFSALVNGAATSINWAVQTAAGAGIRTDTGSTFAVTQADLGANDSLLVQGSLAPPGAAVVKAPLSKAYRLSIDAQNVLGYVRQNAINENGVLLNLASDTVITKDEKRTTLEPKIKAIIARYPKYLAEAATQGVTTEKTDYTSAYDALITYLTYPNSTLRMLDRASGVDGTYEARFNAFDTAEAALVAAIANRASKTSTWTGTDGRPTTLGALDANAGTKLTGIEPLATAGATLGAGGNIKKPGGSLYAVEELENASLVVAGDGTIPRSGSPTRKVANDQVQISNRRLIGIGAGDGTYVDNAGVGLSGSGYLTYLDAAGNPVNLGAVTGAGLGVKGLGFKDFANLETDTVETANVKRYTAGEQAKAATIAPGAGSSLIMVKDPGTGTGTQAGNSGKFVSGEASSFAYFHREGFVNSAFVSGRASDSIANNAIFIGLTIAPNDMARGGIFPTALRFGWILGDVANGARIYENGVYYGASLGAISVDTIGTINNDGVSIRYYLDGVLKRTVPTPPEWSGVPVYAKVYCYLPGMGFADLRAGYFTENNFSSIGGSTKPADNADVTAAQPIVAKLNPVTGKPKSSLFFHTAAAVGIKKTSNATPTAALASDGTATISVPAFTMAVPGETGVETRSYAAATIPGKSPGTAYTLYTLDPDFVGGTRTILATTNPDDPTQAGAALVGSVTTPPQGAATGTTTTGSTAPPSGGIGGRYATP